MPLLARLTERLGLDRRELRAWAMYDWAVSSVQTTIMVAVFPVYFVQVVAYGMPASGASQRIATANTIVAIVVAALGPLLGMLSDFIAAKKRFLALFVALGAMAVSGLFAVGPGDVGLGMTLFTIVLICAAASTVFYEALLPHIAEPREIDRVSTAGYALGYVGGGILLAANLAWILNPGLFGLPESTDPRSPTGTLPVRLALLSVAVWWVIFSLPLFRHVREPAALYAPNKQPGRAFRASLAQFGDTIRELRRYRQALLLLTAFFLYNDGIQTVIKMATAYGAEIGIESGDLITAIMIVQFVGIPCSFLFGAFADRFGAKRSIFVGLSVYIVITILGYFMRTATHFYILAALTGLVQGGTQALSRSLFASLIPAHKSGEFFGFYSVFEKFASILGPLLFALAITVTGQSRLAILSVIVFFIAGAAVLSFVRVDEGRKAARDAEAAFAASRRAA
ncbi:MAG: MFS transporter [Gemmatimonadaceae bacterium]